MYVVRHSRRAVHAEFDFAYRNRTQQHRQQLGRDTTPVDAGGAPRYRVRIGPFPNKATAQDMCWQIKAAKLACLVVHTK